jgi:hypothetical protein
MARLTFRLLTPEEQAAAEKRCGARPSSRSLARCEQKPEHWKGCPPKSYGLIHSGRTPGGYWKFWDVTDAEKQEAAAEEQPVHPAGTEILVNDAGEPVPFTAEGISSGHWVPVPETGGKR